MRCMQSSADMVAGQCRRAVLESSQAAKYNALSSKNATSSTAQPCIFRARRCMKLLPWLLLVSVHTAVGTVVSKDEAANTRWQAWGRASSYQAVLGMSTPLPALSKSSGTTIRHHLPASSCGNAQSLEALDVSPLASRPSSEPEQAHKRGSSARSNVPAAELRAVYLEQALRDRLQAVHRRHTGESKRLRPVSFTLRESHGARNLSPPTGSE